MSNEMVLGLQEKYIIQRVSDGTTVHNCFVLKADTDPVARECIKLYAKLTKNPVLAKDLSEWMEEFESLRCVDPTYKTVCPKVGSPVCCCHCKIKEQCFIDGGEMCKLCESGDVLDVKECKYNIKRDL